MIKDLDFSKFDNPTIQVVWEDLQENFTQDKIKSVKHYFQKKYNTTNVNILTKVRNIEENVQQTIDVSVNVTDTNYQTDLLKLYLKNNGNENHLEEILNLNHIVENKMEQNNVDTTQFKKWYINNHGKTYLPNNKEIVDYMDKYYGKAQRGKWQNVELCDEYSSDEEDE